MKKKKKEMGKNELLLCKKKNFLSGTLLENGDQEKYRLI